MFRTRVLTTVLVVPPVAVLMVLGGLWFSALITLILTIAVIEFCQLMKRADLRPAPGFAVALLWVLMLNAQFPEWRVLGQSLLGPGVSIIVLGSLTWQLWHRTGNPTAAWAVSMAGPLYIGWCGAHLVWLRNMPDGLWWALTVIPAIWLADSGAYLIGRAWGRHKLAPTVSPGKTWEGWGGGVVVSTLVTTGLAAWWSLYSGPTGPTAVRGLLTGLIVGAIAPLGDLVVSMFKRQVGVKDTGRFFPGHGGALDRVDSVLWAAVLGYYVAVCFGSLSGL